MTIEELKNAIDILTGQGNQVDCGGYLKEILQALAMPMASYTAKFRGANDCAGLAALAAALENGAIFNMIINYEEARSAAVINLSDARRYGEGYHITYYDTNNELHDSKQVLYSHSQYEGLASIQNVLTDWGTIPELYTRTYGADDNILCENIEGLPLCNSDRKMYKGVVVDGILTSVSQTTITAGPDSRTIPWEDVQKLVGLPCTAN